MTSQEEDDDRDYLGEMPKERRDLNQFDELLKDKNFYQKLAKDSVADLEAEQEARKKAVEEAERVSLELKNVLLRVQEEQETRKKAEEEAARLSQDLKTVQLKLEQFKEESAKTQKQLTEKVEALTREKETEKEKERRREKEVVELRKANLKFEGENKVLDENLVQSKKQTATAKEQVNKVQSELEKAKQDISRLQSALNKLQQSPSSSQSDYPLIVENPSHRRKTIQTEEDEDAAESSNGKKSDDAYPQLIDSIIESRRLVRQISYGFISFLPQIAALILLWFLELGLVIFIGIPRKISH